MKKYKTNAYLPLSLCFAVCSTGWASEENTAQLKRLQGTVMVNQGAGYVQAVPGMALADGDRVLILADGDASLVYGPACSVELKANSLVTVVRNGDCAVRQQQVRRLGPYYAAAIGVEAVGEGAGDEVKDAAGKAGGDAAVAGEENVVFAGMSMNEIIVVGVGVGAGLGVVVASGGGGGGGKGNGAISPD